MLYPKLATREMRNHPGRAALTMLSIVIGVAAVVAVTLAAQSTHRAFDEIFRTIAGRAALEVAGPVGTSFPQQLLADVAKVPGVAAAAPLIERRSVIFVGDRRVELTVLGIDPVRDRAVHDYQIVAGKPLDQANGVLLSEAFAKNIGVSVGDLIEMVTRRGMIKARIAGLYSSQGTATTNQGAMLLMDIRAAQSVFKAPRSLDAIQLVLAPNASEEAVQAAVAKILPKDVAVSKPASRSALAEQTSLSTEQGLRMARIFSLVVALFIIVNTFLINVTQRRRQLGIMRAVGATRRQIAGLVFCEALMLGVSGALLGAGLGIVTAHYLAEAMGRLYQTSLPPLELGATPYLLAAAVGIGISLLGAAFPARKASHLTPLEAMRDVLPAEIEGASRWMTAAGIGILLLGTLLLWASIVGWATPPNIILGAVLLLIGLVLLLPLVLVPTSAGVARLLRPWLPVESRMAQRQLIRHRARTTLTTGVVFIAISTGIGLAMAVMDNVQDVRDWYHKSIVADFFVRAMAPDMATGLAADLPDELDPKIRQVPGIKSIEALRLVSAKVAGETVVLFVQDFADNHPLEFDIKDAKLSNVRDQLHEGEVVVGSVLAEQEKLKPGDDLTLEIGESKQPFRIAAIADDYHAGGLTVYMERSVARQRLGIEGIDAYIVRADHKQLGEVRRGLQQLATQYGLLLQSFSDIQQKIDTMMTGVVAGLWGMVVLGLLVATFGVANTLMMTVLEQTRELGLLRIVAMTRSQVRRSIFAQALMIGLLALAPGIAAGVGVAYLINWATLPTIGHAIQFSLHPLLLVGGFAVGMIVVVAAAWVPAQRAARIDLPVALRYS